MNFIEKCTVETNFVIACQQGNIQQVKWYLCNPEIDANHCMDDYYRTPLIQACIFGHTEVVKLLLQHSDIGEINKSRFCCEGGEDGNLFLNACKYNRTCILEHILPIPNLDIISHDSKGKTGLMYICEHGNYDMLKLLLTLHPFTIDNNNHNKHSKDDEYNIGINSVDNNLDTGLHYAIKHNHMNIFKLLLLESDINITCVNSDGATPLILASDFQRTEMVKLLLDKLVTDNKNIVNNNINSNNNNNINHVDRYGYTALQYAQKYNNKEIINLISDKLKMSISV